jgi:hypothetical protein
MKRAIHFTELLLSNDMRDTQTDRHTHTHRGEAFMKHVVEISSGAMTYIQRFINIV